MQEGSQNNVDVSTSVAKCVSQRLHSTTCANMRENCAESFSVGRAQDWNGLQPMIVLSNPSHIILRRSLESRKGGWTYRAPTTERFRCSQSCRSRQLL